MTSARKVNDLLERLSGRRLTRPKVDQPSAGSIEIGGIREPEALAAIEQASGRTMTGVLQQYTTWCAMQYITDNRIPGAIVECGTWRGGQAMIAALGLLQRADNHRHIHLFDTFAGMSPPTDRDMLLREGRSAEDVLASEPPSPSGDDYWCIADLADVTEGMRSTGYPSERVHFVEGRVEDTIPEHAPAEIAFLRLDTDWYESTAHELLHLWPRVAPHGIVVIDDYDWWSGSRTATDEYLSRLDFRPFLFMPGNGRALVKC